VREAASPATDFKSLASSARKKREPTKRKAAELIIGELHPKGVPPQHALLNDKLVDQVNKLLKDRGEPEISRETILRAAKRRRK